jgi:NADH-quinone oxidoreductase subunit N
MSIDQVALLPTYCAGGTALAAFVTDLVAPGRRTAVLAATALGTVATGTAAVLVGLGRDRSTFCAGTAGCSYVADHTGALIATLFAALTLLVIALSAPVAAELPAGEYCFLLGCAMTGGVVLGYARDLISLIVALETLTLPLYLLVGLRRRGVAGAEGAVTFFVVSVVSSAVALLGAALLYAATGALHVNAIAAALAGPRDPRLAPLTTAAIALLLGGLSFKLAAVPFHAWAPATYDGAPVPVAAYLSTASKLGGVIAIVTVTGRALRPSLDVAGPVLAALAVLTMTVGNLGALRQVRMVRLLAWSSIAQAGYILAPLGVFALFRGRTPDSTGTAIAATLGYAFFYVIVEIAAFAAVIALRGAADGGLLTDYRGALRRSPVVTAAFGLALVGLAGLPPGLAGLFAKVVVVRALLGGGATVLAIIVAVNAVIGLAYYLRVAVALLAPSSAPPPPARAPWPVLAALGAASIVAIVVGFAPQLVLAAVR